MSAVDGLAELVIAQARRNGQHLRRSGINAPALNHCAARFNVPSMSNAMWSGDRSVRQR